MILNVLTVPIKFTTTHLLPYKVTRVSFNSQNMDILLHGMYPFTVGFNNINSSTISTLNNEKPKKQ